MTLVTWQVVGNFIALISAPNKFRKEMDNSFIIPKLSRNDEICWRLSYNFLFSEDLFSHTKIHQQKHNTKKLSLKNSQKCLLTEVARTAICTIDCSDVDCSDVDCSDAGCSDVDCSDVDCADVDG